MNADTFETATRSAAFGGTTTVISFAAQHVGINLTIIVENGEILASAGSGRFLLVQPALPRSRPGATLRHSICS